MGFLTYEQFDRVRMDVNGLSPHYHKRQFDPISILEGGDDNKPNYGVGNCFSKAMLACGIIALRHQIEPTVAFCEYRHGELVPQTGLIEGTPRNEAAHFFTLVGNKQWLEDDQFDSEGDLDKISILALEYGVDAKTPHDQEEISYLKEEHGDITFFNEVDDFAVISPDDGEITTLVREEDLVIDKVTGNLVNRGIVVYPWREGGDNYLKAIGMSPIDYDKLLDNIMYRCFL